MTSETLNEISATDQILKTETIGLGHLNDQIPREKIAEVRKEGVQNLAEKGLDVFSTIEDVERTKKNSDNGLTFECVKAIKNKTAKILSESISPEDLVTIYNSGLALGPNKIQKLEDRYEHLGMVRKDLILMDEYLQEEKRQASQEDSSLSPDKIDALREDIVHVFNNYEKTVSDWRVSTKTKSRRNPSSETLLRWYVDKSDHAPLGKEGRQLNELINRTTSYVSNTDKRVFDSYINKGVAPVYTSVVLPDELLVNNKNQVIGAVENLPYDEKDINLWIDTLDKALEVREKITKFDDPENADNLATAGFYDLQGAEVNILKENSQTPSGDRVGVNIDGISNFINIANQESFGSRPALDVVDSVTGEVFNVTDDHTIILRFPSDVSPELLRKTGETLQNLTKNKRIIIQTIPYTNNEIGQAAYAAFRHFGIDNKKNPNTNKYISERKNLIDELESKKIWYGAESE